MANPEVVPARMSHALELANNMRSVDVEEIRATSGQAPLPCLRQSIQSSAYAWTGFIDGELVCMFGVTPQSMLTGSGFIWLLGTPDIERYQMTFLRECRPLVAQMASRFNYLHNYVDARNRVSIRWLRWMGFTIGEPEPFGPERRPFRHFELRSPACVSRLP